MPGRAVPVTPEERGSLREIAYNATVVGLRHLHDELRILRVRPDAGIPPWEAGQYVVVGLGRWEPRVQGCQEEEPADDPGELRELVRRPYSLSSRMLDGEGRLVPPGTDDALEIYVHLVREAWRPPALTPRLFALVEGDRLYVDERVHGHYTLEGVQTEDDVIFAATGVGEAPHNAMIAALLARGHRGRIAAVACVRHRADLAYLEAHRRLEERFESYLYIAITTREAENLDESRPDYVGKLYLQDWFASGRITEETGIEIRPAGLHVFLCGNPEMIGIPHHTHDPAQRYPTPRGMVEILEGRGLEIHRPHHPGNIHFERFW